MDTPLNLFICGFATLAASAGYLCGRKIASNSRILRLQREERVQDLMAGSPSESRSTTPADEDKREPLLLPIIAPKRIPSPIQVIPSPPKILKRRRSVAFQAEDEIEDAPAGYPYNLRSLYKPQKKKCRFASPLTSVLRTPSLDAGRINADEQLLTPMDDADDIGGESPPEEDNSAETRVTPESSTPEPSPPRSQSPAFLASTPPPPPLPIGSPAADAGPPSSPRFGQEPTMVSFSTPKPTFTGFKGGFSTFAKQGSLGFVAPSSPTSPRAAWTSPSEEGERFGTSPVEVKEHAIARLTPSQDPLDKETKTGEESETVLSEQRGVKLFIKRGSNSRFTEAILGRLKLLEDKETSQKRLLFRREPLLQPCMNIMVSAGSTKLSWDEEDSAMRVITVNPEDGVVVYALKAHKKLGSREGLKEVALDKLGDR
ncbi:hypothetical protein DL96DRAFT_1627234 [Flagelloscypha sp. PMI_526]|nr:hypothetical protein DL96DRAFT_1627234 [Flagelloscypha sp. PMI_526]